MITNPDELKYWHTYGKLERTVPYNDRLVEYITKDDLVESCILQNEVKLRGLYSAAVPFVIRSYKQTGFTRERI